MPDVSSSAPVDVNQWIVFDVHKNSLVAGMLPATGGVPEVTRLENTERAVRRFVDRVGEPDGLAVALLAPHPPLPAERAAASEPERAG